MILYAILQLTGPPGGAGGAAAAAAAAAAATMPSAADGVRAINKHLRSLGVYGSTAYLTCVYGSSEMPQGFCRLCAVWGGVYMLNSGTLSLELEEDESSGGKEVRAVIGPEGGQRIECGSLVLNADTRLPQSTSSSGGGSTVAAASEAIGGISRCVCILDGPLLVTTSAPAAAAADTDAAGSTNSTQSPPASLAILFPPPAEGSSTISRAGSTIYAHQMDADVGVCPRGKVLLHMSAMSQDGYTPEELLKPALDSLLKEQAAQLTRRGPPTRRHHICRTLTRRLQAGQNETMPLPSSFITSSLATRTEYDASLQLPHEERIVIERKAYVKAACGGRGIAVATAKATAAADALSAAYPVVSVVWGAFFELPLRECVAGDKDDCPSNLYSCDDPPAGVDCEAHVARAREIFGRICPGAPFLPSAEEEEEEEAGEEVVQPTGDAVVGEDPAAAA